MDYSVRDSSILPSKYARAVYDKADSAIRVGIVRKERVLDNGETRYIVEVAMGSRQIPVSCVLMQKWGGVHNFEEFRVRPWVKAFPANTLLPPSAGSYNKRAGDVVLVAFVDGQSREGVILGGLSHPARVAGGESTSEGRIEYINSFNGLNTEIRADGSYKITFNGKAINDALLDAPPTGQTPPAPVYNPTISGSFFGFDANGSFIVTDGNVQLIKLEKSAATGNLIVKSGNAKIELSGTLATGNINTKADKLNIETLTTSMKSTVSHTVESLIVSVKATQMAIGSDQFELFQGLSDLIDALGTLIVTSPVGTCTPLQSAPTWTAQVVPLQIKLKTMITSLKSAESAEFSGEDTPESIGDDVGA